MSRARAAVFNIAFFAWTAVLGGIGLPFLLAPRREAMRFGRFWSRGVLFLLQTIVGLDHRILGRDRIPAGGCIVAMKHQSAWDAIALPVVLDDPAAVVKRELLALPFYGWYMARAGAIAIDRKAGAAALRAMLGAARRAADERRPIVIFPQGTRVAPGAAAAYQPGVYALYQALSLPLVPAVVNSGVFWGRRSFVKRPGQITLEFLEPIPPGWPRRRLMDELEQRIEAATAKLEREAGDGRGQDRGGTGAQTPRGRGNGNQSSSPPLTICSSEYGHSAGNRLVRPGALRSSRRTSLSAAL
jgi:1-acyl-sn-glycerol-3-phosphate acyltransferase